MKTVTAPTRPATHYGTTASTRPIPTDRVYTTGQVAYFCGVVPRLVAKWFDSGRLHGYRIPGSSDRRIPHVSLVRFLKAHSMPSFGLHEQQNVLLVGPCDTLADALRPCFDGDSHTLHLAGNGFAAGVMFRDLVPSACVIDLAMGRSEAVELAAHMRRINPHVFLAALHYEDESGDLTSEGFDAAYQQPCDASALARRILEL